MGEHVLSVEMTIDGFANGVPQKSWGQRLDAPLKELLASLETVRSMVRKALLFLLMKVCEVCGGVVLIVKVWGVCGGVVLIVKVWGCVVEWC